MRSGSGPPQAVAYGGTVVPCTWINARHRVEYGAGFHYTFPEGFFSPHILSPVPPKTEKDYGGFHFMAFRKPVQPAVTGFMLWFSGHFSWCLMAHLPSNPVFCCISGNVTVLRTQPHARKYTLFFPSVKAPAAVRVHSAMTFSAKFLNFPDISKKIFHRDLSSYSRTLRRDFLQPHSKTVYRSALFAHF